MYQVPILQIGFNNQIFLQISWPNFENSEFVVSETYIFLRIFFFFQIITNKELISVNQDKLGVQATCKKNCCSHSLFGGGLYAPLTCPGFRSSWQAWSGPLEHGDFVVIIVNRYDHDIKVC